MNEKVKVGQLRQVKSPARPGTVHGLMFVVKYRDGVTGDFICMYVDSLRDFTTWSENLLRNSWVVSELDNNER